MIIGNDSEISLTNLAKLIINKYGNSEIELIDPIPDDPKEGKAYISKSVLEWSPTNKISVGIDKTFNYFKKILQ